MKECVSKLLNKAQNSFHLREASGCGDCWHVESVWIMAHSHRTLCLYTVCLCTYKTFGTPHTHTTFITHYITETAASASLLCEVKWRSCETVSSHADECRSSHTHRVYPCFSFLLKRLKYSGLEGRDQEREGWVTGHRASVCVVVWSVIRSCQGREGGRWRGEKKGGEEQKQI